MDLALYTRVMLRHRFVLLGGVVLALVLAVFSYYRVDLGLPPKLTPRDAEVWQSSASVLLTQRSQVVPVPGVGDPESLADLASLYARLATSDAVVSKMPRAARAAGSFQAVPSVDRRSEVGLPVVTLVGISSAPRRAQLVVSEGLRVFLSYVRKQQGLTGVPKKSRVELRVLNSPAVAVLVEPRKKTLPIVVFLSVLIAAIASAFVLENRRRVSPVAELELRSEPQELELQPAAQEVDLRPAPQEVELRPAAQEVEVRPAPQEEVELTPAPRSVDLRPAAHTGVDLSPEVDEESEPKPVSVRRWA